MFVAGLKGYIGEKFPFLPFKMVENVFKDFEAHFYLICGQLSIKKMCFGWLHLKLPSIDSTL